MHAVVSESPEKKNHAARGFGRQSWIYGSPTVGDVTPKPEGWCWVEKCAGRRLEKGSGEQRWICTWGRDVLEPVGPRWDRAKKCFEPIIFIWRMRESGVWESWGSTCACMKGRGAGSSQPAWLRNSRDRHSSDASKVNQTVRGVSDSTEWELKMTEQCHHLSWCCRPHSWQLKHGNRNQ